MSHTTVVSDFIESATSWVIRHTIIYHYEGKNHCHQLETYAYSEVSKYEVMYVSVSVEFNLLFLI